MPSKTSSNIIIYSSTDFSVKCRTSLRNISKTDFRANYSADFTSITLKCRTISQISILIQCILALNSGFSIRFNSYINKLRESEAKTLVLLDILKLTLILIISLVIPIGYVLLTIPQNMALPLQLPRYNYLQ